MKKFIVFILAGLFISLGHASKLSRYLDKVDAREQARQQREWQQDMDFSNFAFRLDRRYSDDHGQACRDYEFRAKNNPYRHGYLTVCDER